MALDKQMEALSIKPAGSPPPLPTTAPPPPAPVASPAPTKEEEVDESLIQQQLLSASRLNNSDLLTTIIKQIPDADRLARIINSTKDFSGNSPLHLSCKYGSYEVLDLLLDQPGVEVDPLNRDGESPLFALVRYSQEEPEHGQFIVETLLDAGSDPKLIDAGGQRAIDLVPNQNTELKSVLENAELSEEDFDTSEFQLEVSELPGDDEGSEGESGSDSE